MFYGLFPEETAGAAAISQQVNANGSGNKRSEYFSKFVRAFQLQQILKQTSTSTDKNVITDLLVE